MPHPTEAQVLAVATRLANNRGNRRGVPDVVNILDVLPQKLREEVMDDARSAIAVYLASSGRAGE